MLERGVLFLREMRITNDSSKSKISITVLLNHEHFDYLT